MDSRVKEQEWEDTSGDYCRQKMESTHTAQEGGRVERSIAEIAQDWIINLM